MLLYLQQQVILFISLTQLAKVSLSLYPIPISTDINLFIDLFEINMSIDTNNFFKSKVFNPVVVHDRIEK